MADNPLGNQNPEAGKTVSTLERLRGLGVSAFKGTWTGFGTSFSEGTKALIELAAPIIPDVVEKPTVSALDKITEKLTFGSEEEKKQLTYQIGQGLGNIAALFIPSTGAGKVAQVAKAAKAAEALEAANLVGKASKAKNLTKLSEALRTAGFGGKAIEEATAMAKAAKTIDRGLVSAAASSSAARKAAIGTSMAFGSALESGQAGETAKQFGASEGQQYAARLLGIPVGALEGISNSRYLKSFGASFMKKAGVDVATKLPQFTPQIVKTGVEVLKNAGVEGLEEWSQQVAQNLISKGLYKPNQDLLEGAGEAGVLGALTGGIFDVSVRGAGKLVDLTSKKISESRPITDEEIARAQNDVIDEIKKETYTARSTSLNLKLMIGLAKLHFKEFAKAGQEFNKEYIQNFSKDKLDTLKLEYDVLRRKGTKEALNKQLKKLSSDEIATASKFIDDNGGDTQAVNEFLHQVQTKQEIPVVRSFIEKDSMNQAVDKIVYNKVLLAKPTVTVSEDGKRFLSKDEWFDTNKEQVAPLFQAVLQSELTGPEFKNFDNSLVVDRFLNSLYEKEIKFQTTRLEEAGENIPKAAPDSPEGIAIRQEIKDAFETRRVKKQIKQEKKQIKEREKLFKIADEEGREVDFDLNDVKNGIVSFMYSGPEGDRVLDKKRATAFAESYINNEDMDPAEREAQAFEDAGVEDADYFVGLYKIPSLALPEKLRGQQQTRSSIPTTKPKKVAEPKTLIPPSRPSGTDVGGITYYGKPPAYYQVKGEQVTPDYDVYPVKDRKTGEKAFRVIKRGVDPVGPKFNTEQEARQHIENIKKQQQDIIDQERKERSTQLRERLEKERNERKIDRRRDAQKALERSEEYRQSIKSLVESGRAVFNEKGELVVLPVETEKRPDLIGKERKVLNPEEAKQKIKAAFDKKQVELNKLIAKNSNKTLEQLLEEKLITQKQYDDLSEKREKSKVSEERKQKAAEKARQDAEKKAQKEADKKAKEEAKEKANEEKRQKAEKKAQQEAEKKANEEAKQKAKLEADKKAKEDAKKAKEESKQKAQEDAKKKAQEEADKKAQQKADEKAKKDAEKKAKQDQKEEKKKETKKKVKKVIDQTKADENDLNQSLSEKPKNEDQSQKKKKKVSKAIKKIESSSSNRSKANDDIDQQRSDSIDETGSPDVTTTLMNPAPTTPTAEPTPETAPTEETTTQTLSQKESEKDAVSQKEKSIWESISEQERKKQINDRINQAIPNIKNVVNKIIGNVTSYVENMYAHLDTYYKQAGMITAAFKTLPSYGKNNILTMVNIGVRFNEKTGTLEVNPKKKGFMHSIFEIGKFANLNADQQANYYTALADWLSRNTEIERIERIKEYNKEAKKYNEENKDKEGFKPKKEFEIFYRKTKEAPTAEEGYQDKNDFHYMSRYTEFELGKDGIDQIFNGIKDTDFGGITEILGRNKATVLKEFEKINKVFMEQNLEVLKFALGTHIIDQSLFDQLSQRKFYIPFITIKEREGVVTNLDKITDFIVQEKEFGKEKTPVLFAKAEGGLGSIKKGKDQLGLLINNWQHMLQYGADNRAKLILVGALKNVALPDTIKKQELKQLADRGAFDDPTKLNEAIREMETRTVVEKTDKPSSETIVVSIDGTKVNYRISDSNLYKIVNKDMYSNLFAGTSALAERAKGAYTALITVEPNFRFVNVIQGLGQAIYTANIASGKGVGSFLKNAFSVWKLGFMTSGNVFEDLKKLENGNRELYLTVLELASKGGLFSDVFTTSILEKTMADRGTIKNKNIDNAADYAMKNLGQSIPFDLTSAASWMSLPSRAWNKFLYSATWLEHGARTASYINATRNQEYINKTMDYATKLAELDIKIKNAQDAKINFELDNKPADKPFDRRRLSPEKSKEYSKILADYKELIGNRVAVKVESFGFMAEPVALARTVDIDFSNRSLSKVQNTLFSWIPFYRSKAVGVSRISNVIVDSMLPESVIKASKDQIASEEKRYVDALNESIENAKSLIKSEQDEKQKASYERELASLEKQLAETKDKSERTDADMDKAIAKRIGRAKVFRVVLYTHIALAILQDVMMANADDDSEENTPDYIRYNYFRFPVGSDKNNTRYIPIPMTFGVGAIARSLVDVAKVSLKDKWKAIDPKNTIPDKTKMEMMSSLVNALVNEQESVNRPNPVPLGLGALGFVTSFYGSQQAASPLTGAPYLPRDMQLYQGNRVFYKGKYLGQAGPLFDIIAKVLTPLGKSPVEYRRWSSDYLGTLHDAIIEPVNTLLDTEHKMMDYKNSVGKPKWAQAARMMADSLLIGSFNMTEQKEVRKFYGPSVDNYRKNIDEINNIKTRMIKEYNNLVNNNATEEVITNRLTSILLGDFDTNYKTMQMIPMITETDQYLKNADNALEAYIVDLEVQNVDSKTKMTSITKQKQFIDYEKLKAVRLQNRKINEMFSNMDTSKMTKEQKEEQMKLFLSVLLMNVDTPKEVLGL